jgi:hypothetical protein
MEGAVNYKITLVISILVAAWTIYGLVAPREAMGMVVLILNCLILFGAALGAVGSVMQIRGK